MTRLFLLRPSERPLWTEIGHSLTPPIGNSPIGQSSTDLLHVEPDDVQTLSGDLNRYFELSSGFLFFSFSGWGSREGLDCSRYALLRAILDGAPAGDVLGGGDGGVLYFFIF